MKHYFLIFFSLFVGLGVTQLGFADLRDRPKERIISLAPDLTENLFAIGAGSRLVGVIGGSDYPKAARKLPQVGAYNRLDLEAILALHPDLILAWKHTFSRQLDILRRLGIPIYVVNPLKLTDMGNMFLKLGELTGQRRAALLLAKQFSVAMERLQKLYSGRQKIDVFYQLGASFGWTINGQSLINEMISLCGGQNIFGEIKGTASRVGFESLVKADPDLIVSDQQDNQWKERWQNWVMLRAVKRGLLFSIPPDWVERASPRMVKGAAYLCQIFDKARSKISQDF